MKRQELLKQIRKETREASIAYYTYIYTDREYMEGVKLHLREIYFLMTVGEKGNISMGEIAAALNISRGAATQIASRLLKKKLIMKLMEREDKRRV
ncbi:MAG: MarR family transcriptional regulator, partial [Eubacterium sp.]|nr:MarR family transcriptional regulator [Eubacterium sp.]